MRFLVIIGIVCIVGSLQAQQGFDAKKKQATTINTDELHAQSRKFQPQQAKSKQGVNASPFQQLKQNLKVPTTSPRIFKVLRADQLGNARMVAVKHLSHPSGQTNAKLAAVPAEEVLSEFSNFLDLGQQVGFDLKRSSAKHSLWEQTYKGVPVYGTSLNTVYAPGGQVKAINGQWRVVKAVQGKVNINEAQALEIVIQTLKNKGAYSEIPAAIKAQYAIPKPEVRKVVCRNGDQEVWAYEVELRANLLQNWTFLLSAATGEVLEAFDHTCDVDGPETTNAIDLNGVSREITSYLQGTTYKLEDVSKSMFNSADSLGIIYTLDAKGSTGSTVEDITSLDNTWSPTAVSAHFNASMSYDYYVVMHGRSSIDGDGGNIYSVINIKDDFGNEVDNAYWSTPFMVYGNGDQAFEPLAKGLDVAGHEMTHGVIQAEANLIYQGESGAINESFADIFGALIDSANWTIGEEVVLTSAFPSGALRSLEDPHNGGNAFGDPGWQPKHTDEQYFGTGDNGGVHINSGIPNHAFYLIATSLGKLKAGRIYYQALTTYLTRFSKFVDLRIAVVQSVIDLYGDNSTEQTVVENAFDAVGILDGPPTQVQTTIGENPGQAQLLFVDQSVQDPATIIQRPLSTINYTGLTNVPVHNRPSVSDNGELLAFIGEDHKVYLVDIQDPTNPVQSTLFEEPIYSSVALSKDGSKIALTTVDQDTSIYVHDFVTDQTMRFELYNPTYSEGVVSGGVLYADALEWDYTGENIIYDAFNEVVNENDENIEFWDVGIINVWDKEADDFGTGEIEKLFVGLEKGESIGNPVLSKNSPYIMALDYSYEAPPTFEFLILGYDIQTGELGLIFQNNYISWPSYTKFDEALVFTFVDAIDGQDLIYAGAIVPLAPDKINAGGNAAFLIDSAQYSLIYSKGERDINLPVEASLDKAKINVFPNPVSNTLYVNGLNKDAELKVYDLTGQLVLKQEVSKVNAEVEVSGLSQGLYLFQFYLDDGVETVKVMVK